MAKKGSEGGTIVLKRIEEGGHGHHGGAWKVAYADFVTAMMAFFLLMWLLNATSEEQRRGIADYFAPSNALGTNASGSGLPFGGRTPNSTERLVSDTGAVTPASPTVPSTFDQEEEQQGEDMQRAQGQGAGPIAGPGQPAARALRPSAIDAEGPEGESVVGLEAVVATVPGAVPPGAGAGAGAGGEAAAPRSAMTSAQAAAALAEAEAAVRQETERRAERARQEQASLTQAAEELRAAVRDDPTLAELARQLVVEIVPEGLRIHMLDADRTPMFATGSAAHNERLRGLMQKVAQIAARLPNQLAIDGHTDATPFRGGGGERSNWELSAERANTVRRLLAEAAVPEARIRSVTGHAARNPLLPDQPSAAANRRVSITLLRNQPAPGPANQGTAP